jgi:hypothetical protein
MWWSELRGRDCGTRHPARPLPTFRAARRPAAARKAPRADLSGMTRTGLINSFAASVKCMSPASAAGLIRGNVRRIGLMRPVPESCPDCNARESAFPGQSIMRLRKSFVAILCSGRQPTPGPLVWRQLKLPESRLQSNSSPGKFACLGLVNPRPPVPSGSASRPMAALAIVTNLLPLHA